MILKRLCFAARLLAAVATSAAAHAGVSLSVFPSVAPNVYGSPSWSTYESNAISALVGGASSAGTPGTPGYYSQVPNGGALPIGAFTVTDFYSWLGQANPAAPFDGEYGNRVQYGLHAVAGPGETFAISDLSFEITYDDANYSDYSIWSVPASSYNYSNAYVGLNYGPDGVLGGGDDVWITGGLNTQPINELFARGSGLGYEVLTSFPGATNQDKIDQYNLSTWGTDPFTMTGTYRIGPDAVGAAAVAFNTPEPGTLVMWSLLAVALFVRQRRRRSRG